RRTPLQRLLDRRRCVDEAERQLGGLTENLEQLLGIAETGHLHQDAIVSLTLDRRLDEPELVDPLADDLDRLIDDLPDALEERGLRGAQPHPPPADVLDIDRARTGAAEEAPERLRQLAKFRQSLLQIALANGDLDRIAADDGSTSEADAGLAQDAPDIVLQCHELLPTHVVDIDLEQDVRAALQIETEHNVALRPCRPALDHALREKVGDREQAADQRREQDRRCLTLRDIEHRSSRVTGRADLPSP